MASRIRAELIWQLVDCGKTLEEIACLAECSTTTAVRYKSILVDFDTDPDYGRIRWYMPPWTESACLNLHRKLKKFRTPEIPPSVVDSVVTDLGHPHLNRLNDLARYLANNLVVPSVGALTRPGGSYWKEPIARSPVHERPELDESNDEEYGYLFQHLAECELEASMEAYLTAAHLYARKALELESRARQLVKDRDDPSAPIQKRDDQKHFVAALIWDLDDRHQGRIGIGPTKRNERSIKSDGSTVYRPLDPFAVECDSKEEADSVWAVFESLRVPTDALSAWRPLRESQEKTHAAMADIRDCLFPQSRQERLLLAGRCEECPY